MGRTSVEDAKNAQLPVAEAFYEAHQAICEWPINPLIKGDPSHHAPEQRQLRLLGITLCGEEDGLEDLVASRPTDSSPIEELVISELASLMPEPLNFDDGVRKHRARAHLLTPAKRSVNKLNGSAKGCAGERGCPGHRDASPGTETECG